jgi:hypothetical protein
VTFAKYLNILRKKTMDKATTKEIIEGKKKKRINEPKE